MLEAILAPISQEDFFREYWTKKFVHIPGPPEKFASLFPWEVLNRAIETHRFDAKRIRLVKTAKDIEAKIYLTNGRVDAGRLMTELANGATLIVNGCDELHLPLQRLCVELERIFHVYVLTNLYAGWRTDNGFDVHWDDQDTLILQVAGRKHWKIWNPTRLHPFKSDVVDTSKRTKPTNEPIWDGILEQGSLLSIPRGWWHVAHPMDEPCLHLTVTVKNLNGVNFLHWFAHRMKESVHARMELPVVANAEERQAWLDRLWEDLSSSWKPNLIESFLADVDTDAKPRPALQLPQSVMPATLGPGKETPMALARPRPLSFFVQNGSAHFRAGGTEWKTASRLVPALERFNDGEAHTLAELAPGGDPELNTILLALAMTGVIRSAAVPRDT